MFRRAVAYTMICQEIPSGLFGDIPVLVVGAGPAGIVQALELRRRGVEVPVPAGGVRVLERPRRVGEPPLRAGGLGRFAADFPALVGGRGEGQRLQNRKERQ